MPQREYTAKAYTVIQSQLTKKASSLGGSWTAESVGKVIWIVSILSANGSGPGTLIPEPVTVTSSSSRISKTENEEDSGIINENKNKKNKITDKNDDHVTIEAIEEDNHDTKVTSKRKRK